MRDKRTNQIVQFYKNNPIYRFDEFDEQMIAAAYETFVEQTGSKWTLVYFTKRHNAYMALRAIYKIKNQEAKAAKLLLTSNTFNTPVKPEEKPDWLLTRAQATTDRYIEAEQFMMELAEMPWYQFRMFAGKKIAVFLESRKKYNF